MCVCPLFYSIKFSYIEETTLKNANQSMKPIESHMKSINHIHTMENIVQKSTLSTETTCDERELMIAPIYSITTYLSTMNGQSTNRDKVCERNTHHESPNTIR